MQINKIATIAEKCKKPCRHTSFTGNESSSGAMKKVRYKHYEQMSDDLVSLRSIIKAHQDMQNSNKMKLYKSIPAIATGIIATSIALTQPGKLSNKIISGLGFLATVAGVDALMDIVSNKNDKSKKNKAYATLGALGTVAIGAHAIAKGTSADNKISKFISKEAKQLAKEINLTKLAKYSNKVIEPFMKKHPKVALLASPIATIASGIGGSIASYTLLGSISRDISKKACENYERAKTIQRIAKAHYDATDAIEV